MDYITTAEASKKWGITANRVFILARSGRIPGATRIGSRWMIPASASKPLDGRTRSEKNKCVVDNEVDFFRYPIFEHKDPSSFKPPLSPDELKLKTVTENFFACRFEESDLALGSLPDETNNRYIRLGALYVSCMSDIYVGNADRFFNRYGRLLKELQEEFPHKREMQEYVHEIDATLGFYSYYENKFFIDPEYDYHESFLPRLNQLCFLSLLYANEKLSIQALKSYEMNCILLEKFNSVVDLQAVHTYLGSAYAFAGMPDKATCHFKRSLELAEKYELYYVPALTYYYIRKLWQPALEDFSPEFKNKLSEISDDVHQRYQRFMDSIGSNNIYKLLSHKDYLYVFYASLGYTNEEVAKLLHVSAGTVGKTYSAIYDTLGIQNKKELSELYHNSVGADMLG